MRFGEAVVGVGAIASACGVWEPLTAPERAGAVQHLRPPLGLGLNLALPLLRVGKLGDEAVKLGP